MKALSHLLTVFAAAAVLLGVPVIAFANVDALVGALAGIDTVSSATTIQQAPSGRYTIIINRDKHADADVLGDWVSFFAGEDVPLIMEDIDCIALAQDPAGIEMARSLQSRLPANQMKLDVVQAALALSKADAGLFDVLVMSDEVADAYGADSVARSQDVVVVSR